MTRLNLLLTFVLLCTCAALVYTAYQSRRLYSELDRARNDEQQLALDFKRLDAERQAQATHGRVDRVAREKLHMRTATAAITQYVDLPQSPNPSGSGVQR